MNPSDLISLGALTVAGVAVGLGEWRAWRDRRSRSERNIVDWALSWPNSDGFLVESNGPDDAKGVLVEIWADYVKGEATSQFIRRGEGLVVPMPQLADLWHSTTWKDPRQGVSGHRVNVIGYKARISWKTPSGTRQTWQGESVIQTWIDVSIDDLFGDRPNLV